MSASDSAMILQSPRFSFASDVKSIGHSGRDAVVKDVFPVLNRENRKTYQLTEVSATNLKRLQELLRYIRIV